MPEQFVLVRWVGEETVSVIKGNSVRSGEDVYVGAFTNFKWAGKFYEAEVLKISGTPAYTMYSSHHLLST